MNDDFLDELEQLRRNHCKDYPHRPMQYAPELIQRIVHYVWQQRLEGQTLRECSRKLAIPAHTLSYWLSPRWRRDAAFAAHSSQVQGLLRPVQVSAQVVPVPDGVPERRYTVRLLSRPKLPSSQEPASYACSG